MLDFVHVFFGPPVLTVRLTVDQYVQGLLSHIAEFQWLFMSTRPTSWVRPRIHYLHSAAPVTLPSLVKLVNRCCAALPKEKTPIDEWRAEVCQITWPGLHSGSGESSCSKSQPTSEDSDAAWMCCSY